MDSGGDTLGLTNLIPAAIRKITPRIATTDDPAGKSKCVEKYVPKKLPSTLTPMAMAMSLPFLRVRLIFCTVGLNSNRYYYYCYYGLQLVSEV